MTTHISDYQLELLAAGALSEEDSAALLSALEHDHDARARYQQLIQDNEAFHEAHPAQHHLPKIRLAIEDLAARKVHHNLEPASAPHRKLTPVTSHRLLVTLAAVLLILIAIVLLRTPPTQKPQIGSPPTLSPIQPDPAPKPHQQDSSTALYLTNVKEILLPVGEELSVATPETRRLSVDKMEVLSALVSQADLILLRGLSMGLTGLHHMSPEGQSHSVYVHVAPRYPQDDAEAYLLEHKEQLQACLPATSSPVTLRLEWLINRSGSVLVAQIREESSPLDASVRECIAQTTRRWRFPRAPESSPSDLAQIASVHVTLDPSR